MKLQDQVVSLELAKRLKKLGFKQESLWWWWKPDVSLILDRDLKHTIVKRTDLSFGKWIKENQTNCISAYTVAELGEMLPKMYASFKIYSTYTCEQLKMEKNEILKGDHTNYQTEDTEADARAKMLIYLKENNLLI